METFFFNRSAVFIEMSNTQLQNKLHVNVVMLKHRYPLLFQSSRYTTSRLWKTYLFSLTEGKPKSIFTFREKVKSRNSVQHLCCSELLQRRRAAEWQHQAPSPEPHSAPQPRATRASNCVCEHLCFVSIYFWYLLARCVLWYQKSLREVIFGVWECSEKFPM